MGNGTLCLTEYFIWLKVEFITSYHNTVSTEKCETCSSETTICQNTYISFYLMSNSIEIKSKIQFFTPHFIPK